MKFDDEVLLLQRPKPEERDVKQELVDLLNAEHGQCPDEPGYSWDQTTAGAILERFPQLLETQKNYD